MGINKLKPVCKPKFYSKYGIHRGLQSIKKKKKNFSSSEQCINIPETKEEEEQSSYRMSTATTDRRPHLRILADTNKKTTTSGIHRPRQAIWYSRQIQLSPTKHYVDPDLHKGCWPAPAKKKKNITTRELFFLNHQLLKQKQ